jgi:hypothetical protein
MDLDVRSRAGQGGGPREVEGELNEEGGTRLAVRCHRLFTSPSSIAIAMSRIHRQVCHVAVCPVYSVDLAAFNLAIRFFFSRNLIVFHPENIFCGLAIPD